MNYNIKLDVTKLHGTFVASITGKSTTKKCICIPIEELAVGEKGIYLDLTAWENKEVKFGNTHSVKQSLKKEDFDKLTDEQKKSIPFVGNLSEAKVVEKKNEQVQEAPVVTTSPGDDLPF